MHSMYRFYKITVLYSITQMLLEVIVNTPVQGSGGGQEGSPGRDQGGQRRPLLHFAPSTFNDVVVGLVSQLIVITKDALNPKLR